MGISRIGNEEKLLLRLCVSAPIEDDEFNWDEIDYKRFIHVAGSHNMFGRLQYHTYDKHISAGSRKFWMLMKAIVAAINKMDEKSSKKQDLFIARMLDIMDKNGFNGIVMKGPVLQSIIYADMPYVRPFGYLDVLLPEEQAIAFHAHLLKNEGMRYGGRYSENYDSWYKAGLEMSQHLIPLYDNDGTIEVHHRLNHSFMSTKPNLSVIFEKAEKISTRFGMMTVPDKYDMLIMLCYHMYYHNCYENEMRVSLHVDIIDWLTYIQKTEPKNWVECLLSRTSEHKLFDAVSYCIVHTQQLLECIGFENELDAMLLKEFETETARYKAEEIHSRFMLSERAFGHWNIPYIERFFKDKMQLEKEVAFAIYHELIIEKWEPKLHSIGIYDLHPQEDGHYW